MFRTIRNRLESEKGFTLIELLVVILIIGILAAIALPAFLGQQKKGQDSEAKANARNMVSQVESCFTDTQDYGQCTTAAGTKLDTGGVPATTVTSSAATSYSAVATSKSAAGATFTISKTAGATPSRTCSKGGEGGCQGTAAAGTW